jgi:tetratricopeptide (TPR) repeat protein
MREPPPIPKLTDHISGLDEAGWFRLLEKLREVGLVAPSSDHAPDEVDAHPLVREHFGEELREMHPEAWRAGHARLYEHFKALPEKRQPDTLEELAPLFQAMFHGCQAGRHHEALGEVYWLRISRGDQVYVAKKLGAFGADLAALAGFFDQPWGEPVGSITEADRAFVLNQAGFRLRALGRLTEALPSMRAGLELRVRQESWMNAAIATGNLSGLQLMLGEMAEAIAVAEQSVEYAERSGDAFWRMCSRIALADARHQAGEHARAEELFQEAEHLQAGRQPEYPRLYSLQGYQYCDLLLDFGRHAEVGERAAQTINWEEGRLLDIALDHLSLGRAELTAHEADGGGDLAEAEKQLNQAVDGLRKAGTIHHVPRGLLGRAAYFRITEQYDRARRDLAEAMRVATRCGMRLFECDAHLELARLELVQSKHEVAFTHLARVEELVVATGYHRRDKDLDELKAALG